MDRFEKVKEFFTSHSWTKLEKTKEGHDAAYEFVKDTLPHNKVLFYDAGKVTNDSDGLYDTLSQKQKDLIAYVEQKKEENFQVYQLDGLKVFYIGSTAAVSSPSSVWAPVSWTPGSGSGTVPISSPWSPPWYGFVY